MRTVTGGQAGLFGWCHGRLLNASTIPILQPSVAMHFQCVQSVFLHLICVFAEMLVLRPSNYLPRLLPRFSPTYILSSSLSSTDHHEFTVPSFGGKLEINSCIPVEVVPACPQTFPDMDRAFVKVLRSPVLQTVTQLTRVFLRQYPRTINLPSQLFKMIKSSKLSVLYPAHSRH